MRSSFQAILEITQAQAAAARAGDLDSVMAALEERGRLVDSVGAPSRQEAATLAAIFELEREIATAIRTRMLAVRDEMRGVQHGKRALASYGSHAASSPKVFDLPA